MALSVVNNISSLTAQQNLSLSSSSLSKSLERLSTGLKINRGADGPAALVISEQQRAQIAGLNTAIDNTNKAVSLVQTGEGALNEINSLLVKARSLALDSANSGVNDATAQAANQAEITNILSAIDNIANTTKFGTKNLLNGAAQDGALATGAAGVSITGSLTTIPNLKSFNYTTTAAVKADSTGTGGFTGTGGTLGTGSAGNFTVNGTATALGVADTVDTAVAKINTNLAAAGVAVKAANVGGQLRLTATDYKTNITVTGTTATLAAAGAVADSTRTAATLTYTNTAGVAVTATAVITGTNDASKLTLTGELAGAVVSLGDSPVSGSVSSVAPTNANFIVGEKLTFQIGANSGETTTLSINRVSSNVLGVGASTSAASLSAINLTTTAGAQASIAVIDKAISDVSTIRGQLGAFQGNTLESNARSLSATLSNTTSAESIIRDTDFSKEIANFTRLQTQVQAGATVLGNANQTSALVAQLLRA